jgi:hypothetical protein
MPGDCRDHRFCPVRREFYRAGLSGPSDRDDRAVDAGILRRHPRPRADRGDGRPARPALRDLQQAGRGRHTRHRGGRAGEARRLHADAWRGCLDHRSAADRAERRLRPAIVRADLPDLQERPGDRGAARHLQEPRRDRRREQSQARRAQFRQSRSRHHPAPGDGRVRAAHQGRVQSRAVRSRTCRP